MDIAYLTLEAPREGHANYTHVHEIIAGLRRRGCSVTLYQPPYAGQTVLPPLWRRLLSSLWLQAKMWTKWKRGRVLYIRGHYLAFPSAVMAKIFGAPIIHEINGPYDDVFIVYPGLRRVRPILIWMQRIQYKWATACISVTQALCDWISRECNGRDVHLVPNGANTDLFHPGYAKPADAPAKYALFFGGLAKWHRIDAVIEAFQSPSWPADVDLVIIGDGPQRDLVQAAASANAHIHALGRKPYHDIPAYAANALCGFVVTGDSSGLGQRAETGLFPLKLFETLACGIPAIVTDFPGQADLIRHSECGIVVPPDGVAELAEAVAWLNANPDQASVMGQRGHLVVVAEHSWDARAGQTFDIIKKLQVD